MFQSSVYTQRRQKLAQQFTKGLLVFPGNGEVPCNYPANAYPFRQDSSFLYFFGIDEPGFAGIIDVENGKSILFGDDRDVSDIVWMGADTPVIEKGNAIGADQILPYKMFAETLKGAHQKKAEIHLLPQYRGELVIMLADLFKTTPTELKKLYSIPLIKAVTELRSVKEAVEITEIEKALLISYAMLRSAVSAIKPGVTEREIAGILHGVAHGTGSGFSFHPICSVRGETLHNHSHGNTMQAGELLVIDSGAESLMHYASDITRTYPVSGTFSGIQKDLYTLVLTSQLAAIEKISPKTSYREVHLHAATVIADGLIRLGLMKGNAVDAVAAGAHALFFPHGLGHMMGLDVHDMEGLGENYVGYDDSTQRSQQFGLSYLRLAKSLKPGFVLTVEPGIYFIPELIRQWSAEKRCADFINYDKVESLIGFGGIRIEDDVLVTEKGCRVLGCPIPKFIDEIEAIMRG